MNENKINQAELVNLLTKHDEFTERSAEKFLIELKNIAQEALLRDQILKVPNVGTFRLVWTEGRKSVDVRNGQEINIAGHYKLTFTPDAALKECTNATSEPTEHAQDAPMQKLSQQAKEIKSLLDDVNDSDDKGTLVIVEEPQEPEQSTENPIVVEHTTEEIIVVEEPQSEDKTTEERPTNPYIPPIPKNPEDEPKAQEPEKKRKKHGWIWVLIIVLLLAAFGAVVYFFYFDLAKCYYDDICDWYKAKFQSEQVAEPTDETEYAEVDEMIDDSETEVAETAEETDIFAQPRDYSQTLAHEIITKNIYLATLSRKYYHHTDFWVYIYEANKNVLSNPSAVELGMRLRIPKMDARLIDADDAHAVEFAKKLGESYLK